MRVSGLRCQREVPGRAVKGKIAQRRAEVAEPKERLGITQKVFT